MEINIRILGCGAAAGVPMISSGWGACNPENPKNNRLRSSIYANVDGVGLLFDTSPDLREQLLRMNMEVSAADLTGGKSRIDAVVYTHLHADHTDGVNELREINKINNAVLPIYADKPTMKSIEERFWYAFEPIDLATTPLYHVILEKNIIKPYCPFTVKGIEIGPFLQGHGYMDTLGFRIGDFAYSTDAVSLDEKALDTLFGVKVWVVGCLDYGYHPTHAGVEQVLKWYEIVKPEKIILTHMGNHLDYDELCAKLPENIRPAYDGMEIKIG